MTAEPKSPTESPRLRRQANGGFLQSGNPGNVGGPGRPPSAIRALCAQRFADRVTIACAIADDAAAAARDRLAALDLLGRYGGLRALDYDPSLAARTEQKAWAVAELFDGIP